MEKCLKNIGDRNEMVLKRASIVILSLFAVLAYVDIISVMVPFVLAAYGVMSVLSIAYIIYYFKVKKDFSFDLPFICFLCFTFFTILSMIVNKGSMDRNAVAVFNLLQIAVVSLTVFALKDDIERVVNVLCVFISIFSLIVLVVYHVLLSIKPDFLFVPQYNALGALLAITLLVLLFFIFSGKSKLSVILATLEFLVIAISLRQTTSRSAILSFMGAFCIFLFLYVLSSNQKIRKYGIIGFIGVGILLLCFVIPQFFKPREGFTSVLTGRDLIWEDALKALKGHFLLGFGGNSDKMFDAFLVLDHYRSIHFAQEHLMHNIYLQILIEYGLFTLLAFIVCVCFIIIKNCIFALKSSHENSFMSVWGISFICLFLIHGIAESSILYIGGPEQFTFIFVMALLYLNVRRVKV